MILIHVALALLTFGVVLLTIRLRPHETWQLAPLFVLAIIAVEIRLEVRPAQLSYVLLASVLFILQRNDFGRRAALRILPLIFLAWANTHTFFVLGWAALGCFVVGSLIRDRKLDRALAAWTAASLITPLVNPYGWKAVALQLTQATRLGQENVFAQQIGELLTLSAMQQLPFYPRAAILAIQVFIGLAVLSLPLLWMARRYSSVLLLLIFVPLSLTSVRMAPLLTVVALPPVAWAGADLWHRVRARVRFNLPSAVRLGAVLLFGVGLVVIGLRVFHDAYYIEDRRKMRFGLGWNEKLLPVRATDYLEAANPAGQMFNQLGFGGYLMWKLRRPVFIDGRLEVMGEEFYELFDRARRSKQKLQRVVDRYGIGWVIFPYRLNPYPGLTGELSRDPNWDLAYVDGQAVVFFVGGRSGSARIDDSARRATSFHAEPGLADLPGLSGRARVAGVTRWLAGTVARQRFPSEDYHLGLFHYFRGEPRASAFHFARAIRESGGAYFEIYNNLGTTLLYLGRYADARDCLELYLEARPDDAAARERFEQALARAGPGSG